jgi:hypothetical protein
MINETLASWITLAYAARESPPPRYGLCAQRRDGPNLSLLYPLFSGPGF